LKEQIVSLGGTAIPEGDIDFVINYLTGRLMNTIPEAVGPGRFNLIQQFQDIAQLESWMHEAEVIHGQISWNA
jgi:hypothetical protein